MSKSKKQKQHWYRWVIGECPVCGRDQSYRERVYGKRPKDRNKRYEYLSNAIAFCCGSSFC